MALVNFGDIGNTISTLANPYGSPSAGVWNLQRGSFTLNTQPTKETIFFYVESAPTSTLGQIANVIGDLFSSTPRPPTPDPQQKTAIDTISDGGGRRLAVYEYPYQDGQEVEDLGRRGEKFTFNIKFFGDNYQVKFKEFIDSVVNAKVNGILSHPVRGNFTCRFQEYEFVHRHDEWNAVTIKATFIEDNGIEIQNANLKPASSNSALRSALQTLVSLEAGVSDAISTVSAALLLPTQIQNSLRLRLSSITGQASRLLGQLAATFGTDAQIQSLFAGSNGNVTTVNSGKTSSGTLPAVFQVGFSSTDQANINAQLSQFILTNQLTSQQAVFSANQVRASLSTAITEVESITENQGFDIVMLYRAMANQIQFVTQSCIASAQPQVVVYQVRSIMSLRMVAFLNGLSVDAQNQILLLNPYISSVNYVLPGTMLLVPVAA